MWTCTGNRKRLNAYLDDELPQRIRSSVERHLAKCQSCRTVLDGMRGLKPYLQTLDTPPVPGALTSRILAEASLRQKKSMKNRTKRQWRPLLPQPWLFTGPTTAALLVGLAMGAYMGWTSYRTAGLELDNESIASSLYAFDVLSAEPRGSIEAATLMFLVP